MLSRIAPFAAFLLLGCQAPKDTPAAPPEPFKPGLGIRPIAVSLAPGATQAFQAEINYPKGARYLRQPVVWRVVEPDGGTVTPAGLYTAPTAPGIFHVEVKREDFPEVVATATVTVQ
ncbi:hypothetical protein [Geothrix sp. 21YS21S-4]|uniref:hypothetical protein n=1 Tax=Geothrix sp. 21YS21S-4 TaxID=3068889 RepID=UPI0027B89D15|nr:hypothetical protein [Geothrix sp. 21YS21S-4]